MKKFKYLSLALLITGMSIQAEGQKGFNKNYGEKLLGYFLADQGEKALKDNFITKEIDKVTPDFITPFQLRSATFCNLNLA